MNNIYKMIAVKNCVAKADLAIKTENQKADLVSRSAFYLPLHHLRKLIQPVAIAADNRFTHLLGIFVLRC